MILLDDAQISSSDAFPKQPFTFTIRARSGREYFFATPTAEARGAWIRALGEAPYTAVDERAKMASVFLEKARDVAAPWAAAFALASLSGHEGPRQAALDADLSAITPEAAAAARTTLSADGILSTLTTLLDVHIDARAVMADQVAEADALRVQLEELALRSRAPPPPPPPITVIESSTATSARDIARIERLTSERDEGNAKIAMMTTKFEALLDELASVRMAAAAAATTTSSSSSPTTTSRATGAESLMVVAARRAAEGVAAAAATESAGLRARLAEVEVTATRALNDAESRLRAAEKRAEVAEANNAKPVVVAAQPPKPPVTRTTTTTTPTTVVNETDAEWAPFLQEAQRLEKEGK